MKFRISGILFAALALAALVSSCKEKETTKEYLDGSLDVVHKLRPYVKPGEKYTFTVSGVTAPDGSAVGYYYTAPVTGIKDTLKNNTDVYTLEIPDTVGTFSLTCTAYPKESSDKYYASSASVSFVIVRDGLTNGSITNVGKRATDKVATLYGRDYYVTSTGGREWIRQNLSYIKYDAAGNPEFGFPFASSPAMQNVFGAYYTWSEAVKACPDGWHLPTGEEWAAMLVANGAPSGLKPLEDSPSGAGNLMVKACFNGEVMWDYYRSVNISDKSISALPVGYARCSDGTYYFQGYANYAAFWTADEFDGLGVYRYIYKENDSVYVGTADKSGFAASVRCVR